MISLIVSTIHRTEEIERLLVSLESQTYREFEIIIVDQNSDDRLLPVLARHCDLRIVHLRSERGLSRGRNVGLSAAQGDIIAIPDDDCWYPPELLAAVSEFFKANEQFAVLLTSVRDEHGNLQRRRRRSRVACECNFHTIWNHGISFNTFWRQSVSESVGEFDERIGAGANTVYQSGEETDYCLRALNSGFRIWFDPCLSVFHPLLSVERTLKQTYPYALGTGFVLRKHGYSLYRLFRDFLVFSFGGALVSACKFDVGMAEIRLLRCKGQLIGYCLSGSEMKCAAHGKPMAGATP